jgi:ubiquinone/menaquinone biosynthesis C-methylase UbiE
VVSLCALEHFGLGRYGDEFDMNADKKALSEMIRVLKPNGRLILSTTITRARPTIVFNAHRIYSHKMLRKFLNDLICEDEKFFSKRIGDFCSLNEITEKPKWYMIDLMDTDFVK